MCRWNVSANGNKLYLSAMWKQVVTKPNNCGLVSAENAGKMQPSIYGICHFMQSGLFVARFLLLAVTLCVLSGTAQAEFSQGAAIQLAQYEQLPPEQRREMRRQMREHWQQMPEEQRQERRERFRDDRQNRREAFQQMPHEDRQRMREELRGRHEFSGERRGPEGRGRH